MSVNLSDVKVLREKSGAGMLDCKNALEATSGDIDAAMDHLRKKGLAAAGKKAGRIAAEGLIHAVLSENKTAGVLLEVNCETDFVAKTDKFVQLVDELGRIILDKKPASPEALLGVEIPGGTVDSYLNETIAVTGEKISVRRFQLNHREQGVVHAYIHAGGGIGVLLDLKVGREDACANDAIVELYSDLAMHVAATAPSYLAPGEVPEGVISKEIEIYKEQLRSEGKKEDILEKIALGKLNKFYQDNCLLEQAFVKDSKVKIKDLVLSVAKSIGTEVEIAGFTRYVRGEGIEKRQDDFASEVMASVQ